MTIPPSPSALPQKSVKMGEVTQDLTSLVLKKAFPALITSGSDGYLHIRDLGMLSADMELCMIKKHKGSINTFLLYEKENVGLTCSDDGTVC
jgi:hypothetical protein